MIRLFYTLSVIVALAWPTEAATWYVDYATGDDSRAGTSDGTSWKHVPGDDAATDVAGAAVIAASDTILIKDDTTYVLTNGSIGLKTGVTYDSYGSGVNPIFTNNNTTGSGFSDAAGPRHNVTIRNLSFYNIGGYPEDDPIYDTAIEVTLIDAATDTVTTAVPHGYGIQNKVHFIEDGIPSSITGADLSNSFRYIKTIPTPTTFTMQWIVDKVKVDFDITTIGTGAYEVVKTVTAPRSGTGIVLTNGSDNALIENCAFSYIGQWRRIMPMDGTNSITGNGILLEDNDGVTIQNCTFEHMRVPIGVKSRADTGPVENILIEGCTMDKFAWGMDIGPSNTGAILRDITIKGTTFKNKAYYDQSNWGGFGDSPHTDGIFFRTSAMLSTWDNIVVDGCTFYSDLTSTGGSYDLFVSQGPSVRVQNCVFLQGRDAYAINIGYKKVSGMTQTIEIFNNTFITTKTPIKITTGGDSIVTANRIDVRNNLFFVTSSVTNSEAANVLPTNFAEFVWNNNLYWKLDDINTTNLFSTTTTGGYKTFASWQSTYSGLSVDTNGVLGNPLIASRTGDPSTWLPYTLPGSPVIGAGENLSAFFTNDFLDGTRHASAPWDIGAFDTATPPPTDSTAPTLLSATIDQTGAMLTLVFSEPVQGVNMAHYTISGHTFSGLTGAGGVWACALTPIAQAGPNKTIAYTSGAGRTRDLSAAENPLATIASATVTNNSAADTPDEPTPGKRGRGAKGLVRGR